MCHFRNSAVAKTACQGGMSHLRESLLAEVGLADLLIIDDDDEYSMLCPGGPAAGTAADGHPDFLASGSPASEITLAEHFSVPEGLYQLEERSPSAGRHVGDDNRTSQLFN